MLSFTAMSRRNPVATHFYMDNDNTTSSYFINKTTRLCASSFSLLNSNASSKARIWGGTGEHPEAFPKPQNRWFNIQQRARCKQTPFQTQLESPNCAGWTFLLNHHFLANSTNKIPFKASRVRQHTQIQALTLQQETCACTDEKITSGPMPCMVYSLSPSSMRVGPATLHSTTWSEETQKESLVDDFLVLGVSFRFYFSKSLNFKRVWNWTKLTHLTQQTGTLALCKQTWHVNKPTNHSSIAESALTLSDFSSLSLWKSVQTWILQDIHVQWFKGMMTSPKSCPQPISPNLEVH